MSHGLQQRYAVGLQSLKSRHRLDLLGMVKSQRLDAEIFDFLALHRGFRIRLLLCLEEGSLDPAVRAANAQNVLEVGLGFVRVGTHRYAEWGHDSLLTARTRGPGNWCVR